MLALSSMVEKLLKSQSGKEQIQGSTHHSNMIPLDTFTNPFPRGMETPFHPGARTSLRHPR
jgi:hypothetical protein